MNELSEFCSKIKMDFNPKIRDSKRYVKCWSEKDVLNHRITDTFVIILRTKGCTWSLKSGCTMCGYFNDSLLDEIADKDLLKQFELAIKNYKGERFVKIFNSGSFLDDKEISPKVRLEILNILSKKVKKISVESRPEYITDKILLDIKKIINSKIFEIGIGLETANDIVRKKTINKGFNFVQYKKAADILKKYNYKLKTYVLVKPPFLTEKESIFDCINTIDKIKDITNVVSLNPVNVQRYTMVEYLWKRNKYRPPWLWSILEILKNGKKIIGNKIIKCDIVGGGNIRGAHNCGKCDGKILKAIKLFSLNQNINELNVIDCDCYDKWLDQIDIENIGFGSFTDIYR